MEEKESQGKRESNDIYSNAVRAGKRTYFFDVRSTRKQDYYLTITESKRLYNEDGSYSYKKHKIFIYKEDFEKFGDALKDAFVKIIELNKEKSEQLEDKMENQFTDVSFEELGSEDGDTAEKSSNSPEG